MVSEGGQFILDSAPLKLLLKISKSSLSANFFLVKIDLKDDENLETYKQKFNEIFLDYLEKKLWQVLYEIVFIWVIIYKLLIFNKKKDKYVCTKEEKGNKLLFEHFIEGEHNFWQSVDILNETFKKKILFFMSATKEINNLINGKYLEKGSKDGHYKLTPIGKSAYHGWKEIASQ